jgi:hypothetical protein
MLKVTKVHQEIKKLTGQSVTQKATYQLIDYWEQKIQENINKIPIILSQINEQRAIQGLRPLKQINSEMIQEAINIYKETDANNLQKNGGEIKGKQQNELASEEKKEYFSMEVQ